MSQSRREFLKIFLLMFQDGEVEITSESPDLIEARVMWDDDDEWEYFRWPMSDEALPDMECLVIARFLKTHNLIDLDKIYLSRRELFDRILTETKVAWSFERFDRFYDDLLNVDVPLIEDGKRVDSLWIHE